MANTFILVSILGAILVSIVVSILVSIFFLQSKLAIHRCSRTAADDEVAYTGLDALNAMHASFTQRKSSKVVKMKNLKLAKRKLVKQHKK